MVQAGELLEFEARREQERAGSPVLLRSPCMDQSERAAELQATAQDSKGVVGLAMNRPAVAAAAAGRPVERKPAAVFDRQDVAQRIPAGLPDERFGSVRTQRIDSVAVEPELLGRVQDKVPESARDKKGTDQSRLRDCPAR